jgi:hypothetical protein
MSAIAKQDAAPHPMPSDAVIERFAAQLEPLYCMFNWHWWDGNDNGKCGVPSVEKIAMRLKQVCEPVASGECISNQGGGLCAIWDEECGRISLKFVPSIEADYA